MPFSLTITRSVLDILAEGGEALEGKFFDCVDLIGSFPEIGGAYIPQDGDDEPPIPCRRYHILDTHKTIYYSVDREREEVRVFALVDQRRNPAYRFREARRSDLGDEVRAPEGR